MQTKNTFNINSITIAASTLLALVLSSCGTYYNGAASQDGIYETETRTAYEEEVETSPSSNYYKQYFASKDKDFENLPEEGAIFTDIEASSTSKNLTEEGTNVISERDYPASQGIWGNNGEKVTVKKTHD